LVKSAFENPVLLMLKASTGVGWAGVIFERSFMDFFTSPSFEWRFIWAI